MSNMAVLKTVFFIILLFVLTNGKRTGHIESRILLHKQILNKYIVEDKDLIIKYTMHNVGHSAATDVKLTDNTFDPALFVKIIGELPATIHTIPPQENVSHVVILKPNISGYYNFSFGEVYYKDPHNPTMFKVTFSNEPGTIAIMKFREYNRKFSSHFWDWLVFFIMVAPLLGTPFALWYHSDSKYRKVAAPRKKNR